MVCVVPAKPGPITTNGRWFAKLWPQLVSTSYSGGYGSRPSPGRQWNMSLPPAQAAASISTTIFPIATCSPSATSIAATVPATPAMWTCSIFIASSVITG